MKNHQQRKNPSILPLFLLGAGLFLMLEFTSIKASYPAVGYTVSEADSSFASKAGNLDAGDDNLQLKKKEGQQHLTLYECVRIALERNHDIHLADEALLQARADITLARAAMLPFLGAEGSYARLDEDLAFALGPQSMTFMYRDLYKAGIVVRQPIFMGGRLNAARKASRYSRDARAQEKRSVEEEIIYQVTRAYRTAQLAAEFQKVAAEAVNLLETHEHDVAILVHEGANPELDLLLTRTELANARKELNAADNALDLALSAIKNLLVIDLQEPLSLKERFERPPRPAEDLPTLTVLAIAQRPEILSLRSQLAAAEQSFKATKGEYLPTVALEGRYEYLEGDFRDLDGGYHWTIGIGAQVPLWNWKETGARVRKAISRLEQVKIQLAKLEDSIRLEVREAYLNIGKSEKNIDAAESALETANEAFRMARVKYQAGEGTNTEVLDARMALSRAEANHAQALFEYNVALAGLQRAVGLADAGHMERKESTR